MTYRIVLFLLLAVVPPAWGSPLTLDEASAIALARDPVLQRIEARALSYRETAAADAALPDPVLGTGLMREQATGYRIELRQVFPPGRSRAHMRNAGLASANAESARADDRRLQLPRLLEQVWIDLVRQHETLQVIQGSREALATLSDATTARYAQTQGRQQAVIALEIERTRLEEQALRIVEAQAHTRAQLFRWVGAADAVRPLELTLRTLPDPPALPALLASLEDHPLLRAEAAQVDARLAEAGVIEESFKPLWSLALGHTQRGSGSMMPDETSAMLTWSLPLFSSGRQDRRLAAAQSMTYAASHARIERLFTLQARVEALWSDWERMRERRELYDTQLLPMGRQQVDAAMSAYAAGSDTIDAVVRAHLAVHAMELERIDLEAGLLKTHSELLYLAGVAR